VTTKNAKIAAHYNVDSNVIRVQLFITDECDPNFHPEVVVNGKVRLFNVFNTPAVGLQQIPLEQVDFDKSHANKDGFFNIFFVNPAVNTNLEARATLELEGQGEVTSATMVLADAGTFSDSPQNSVIGNAVNRSWHLDPEKERDEPFQNISPHNPIELGENQTVVIKEEASNRAIVDIKFEELAEKKSADFLDGQLIYLGGGGRLLPRLGVLVFQNIDTPGWELGASTFSEQGSIQLLPNNTYIDTELNNNICKNFPAKYTMDSPGIKIVNSSLLKLQGEGFDAKVWALKLNGASPPGISPFTEASIGLASPVPFDATKPIALSLLAGMEKNSPESDITKAKLVFNFFDFADRQLPSITKILNPDDLFNARPLRPFSIQSQPSQHPLSAEKFTWRLEIGSIEQADFITVLTALPSVTNTQFATSQVLTEQIRVSDNLSYIPETPFSVEEGAAVFNVAVGFDGAPFEDKYIFDTRDPITLNKGISFKVNANGTLTLTASDETTTATATTSTPTNWVSGKIHEIVAEWRTSAPLLRISVDGEILLEDTTTTLPVGLTTLSASSIQLGASAQVQNHIDSEFIRAVFLKRPR